MTFCYWKAPQNIIKEKAEYVLFVLLFGAVYLIFQLVSLTVWEIFGTLDWNAFRLISILAFPLLCFVSHLLYPFKSVNKNLRQHINFFLFFATLLSMAIAGFLILLEFSNM